MIYVLALIAAGFIAQGLRNREDSLPPDTQIESPAGPPGARGSPIQVGSTAKTPAPLDQTTPIARPSGINLQPMYGANIKQNIAGGESATWMNALNGGADWKYVNHQRKQEVINESDHSGSVQRDPNYQNIADQYRNDFDQNTDTLNAFSNTANNTLPFEQIRVGPGLGVGNDVAATGGFHSDYRILPKNLLENKNRRDQMKELDVNKGVSTNGFSAMNNNKHLIGEMSTTKATYPEGTLLGAVVSGKRYNFPEARSEHTHHSPQVRGVGQSKFNQGITRSEFISSHYDITSPSGPGVALDPRLQNSNNNTNFRPALNNNPHTKELLAGQPVSQVSQFIPNETNRYLVNDTSRSAELQEAPGFISSNLNSTSASTSAIQQMKQLSRNNVNMRSIDSGQQYEVGIKGLTLQNGAPSPETLAAQGATHSIGSTISTSQRGINQANNWDTQEIPGNVQSSISNASRYHNPVEMYGSSVFKTTRGSDTESQRPGIATGTNKLQTSGALEQHQLSSRGLGAGLLDSGLGYGPVNSASMQIVNKGSIHTGSTKRATLNNNSEGRGPNPVGSSVASIAGSHTLSNTELQPFTTVSKNNRIDKNYTEQTPDKMYTQYMDLPALTLNNSNVSAIPAAGQRMANTTSIHQAQITDNVFNIPIFSQD